MSFGNYTRIFIYLLSYTKEWAKNWVLKNVRIFFIYKIFSKKLSFKKYTHIFFTYLLSYIKQLTEIEFWKLYANFYIFVIIYKRVGKKLSFKKSTHIFFIYLLSIAKALAKLLSFGNYARILIYFLLYAKLLAKIEFWINVLMYEMFNTIKCHSFTSCSIS